jgi:hypothetical protein
MPCRYKILFSGVGNSSGLRRSDRERSVWSSLPNFDPWQSSDIHPFPTYYTTDNVVLSDLKFDRFSQISVGGGGDGDRMERALRLPPSRR